MANTAQIQNSYLVDMLGKVIDLNSGGDSLKMALYVTTASIGPTTAAYTATGEVSGTGYSATGEAVTHATNAANTGATAYWTPSADVSWTGLTPAASFDCALLYSVTASNAAIAAFTFTAQDPAGSDFTLVMPTNDASTGLIRISDG